MRCIRVTPASSTGKGMKLSGSRCLCGLHLSLVFKPHIVPDLLPIAGSKPIMQLLLIKQRFYIFISIRLLIPQYFFSRRKGSASLGRWRKLADGMVLEMPSTSTGRTCSPHVSFSFPSWGFLHLAGPGVFIHLPFSFPSPWEC